MSVKDEVLSLLRNQEWSSCEDFERLFPPKSEGHLSWGQRLRQLRTEGYRIIKRKKANCKHTWEYHLVSELRTPAEQALCENNLLQEEKINMVELAKSVCGVDRKAFETPKGQLAFIG